MKMIATLAALSAFAFLGACASTQNTTAPGAVGTKSAACCGKCGNTCSSKAAPGAVSETKKEGCCASKAAPGAVSGKSDCSAKASCGAKSDCSAAKSAPGAVSGKSDCSTKSGCASKCPATKG